MFSQHGSGEQERILQHHGDIRAERLLGEIAGVAAIDQDAAGIGIVEARHQREQCGLACARATDQRDRLTRFYLETNASEDGMIRIVSEADVIEGDFSPSARHRLGVPFFSGTESSASRISNTRCMPAAAPSSAQAV